MTRNASEDKLVCSGEFEAADLRITGTSTTVADLIGEVATLRQEMAAVKAFVGMMPPPASPPPAAPPPDCVYVIGGQTPQVTDSVLKFIPGEATWSSVAALPDTRYGHAATTSEMGIIYAVAGHDAPGSSFRDTVFTYDGTAGTWSEIDALGTNRYGVGAAVLNGSLYAVGGWNGACLASAQVLDLAVASSSWSTVSSLHNPRYWLGVAALNGYIYAVGGYCNDAALASVERYDPHAGAWTRVADLSTPRGGLGVVSFDGYLYAAGGSDQPGSGMTESAVVERYDPVSDEWTFIGELIAARSHFGMTVANGLIYTIGGCTQSCSTRISSVETLDPTNGSWYPSLALPGVRHAFAAAVTGC